jgi:hypothetical protein
LPASITAMACSRLTVGKASEIFDGLAALVSTGSGRDGVPTRRACRP